MWAFTEKDGTNIEEIYRHFQSKFPSIGDKFLHDRIFRGYCWGEGRLRIVNIDDWNNVFYKGKLKGMLTYFADWNDYLKYDGDYHKKKPFPKAY